MTRTTTAALLALLIAAAPLHVSLAEADEQQAPGAQDAELMEAQQRLQELQRQLGQIQQDTFEASDELQEKQRRLEERATAKMEDLGYDPERHYSRMQEIYERFEAGDVSEAEQQELAEEFHEAQMQLQQEQQEAMRDDEFRESMERDMREFQEDLLAAMEADYPETADLMAELEELQQRVQEGMQQQMPEGLE